VVRATQASAPPSLVLFVFDGASSPALSCTALTCATVFDNGAMNAVVQATSVWLVAPPPHPWTRATRHLRSPSQQAVRFVCRPMWITALCRLFVCVSRRHLSRWWVLSNGLIQADVVSGGLVQQRDRRLRCHILYGLPAGELFARSFALAFARRFTSFLSSLTPLIRPRSLVLSRIPRR
jgi:hypothetical protein